MGCIMIRKQLISNFVMNVKTTAVRWDLYIAYLTGELVALFCQSTLPCPRTLIINNFATFPPRALFTFEILRSPLPIAFMRAKWTISTAMFKFIRLTKDRFVALYTMNYFARPCFHSARFTAIFAWFIANNISINNKIAFAILASFRNFWLMLHGIIVTHVNAMSSKMLVSGDFCGKRWMSNGGVRSRSALVPWRRVVWRGGVVRSGTVMCRCCAVRSGNGRVP